MGLVKVWSLVEKTSSLNNNEAVSNDPTHTWTCTTSYVHSEEPATGITFGSDGSVYAISHPRSISLWSADTHSLLHVLPSPPPYSPVCDSTVITTNVILTIPIPYYYYIFTCC